MHIVQLRKLSIDNIKLCTALVPFISWNSVQYFLCLDGCIAVKHSTKYSPIQPSILLSSLHLKGFD